MDRHVRHRFYYVLGVRLYVNCHVFFKYIFVKNVLHPRLPIPPKTLKIISPFISFPVHILRRRWFVRHTFLALADDIQSSAS